MELKGIISAGESKSLTCCTNLEDILIDGVSLYEKLDELFNQDTEEYWNYSEKQSPRYGVKYVILNERPKKEKSFNDKAADVINQMLYADHVNGCYSEWTCGYGGFDYAIEGGHSIFEELKSHIGKYVHFVI